MFVMSNIVLAIAKLLHIALEVYFWIIIARALVSWVSPDPYNPIVRFLYRVTEPVLRPIRQRLPVTMNLDLSPLVVLLALKIVEWVVVESLRDFAISIR
jgi:YggT family protein